MREIKSCKQLQGPENHFLDEELMNMKFESEHPNFNLPHLTPISHALAIAMNCSRHESILNLAVTAKHLNCSRRRVLFFDEAHCNLHLLVRELIIHLAWPPHEPEKRRTSDWPEGSCHR